mgnify:FL=1
MFVDPFDNDPFVLQARADEEAREQRQATFQQFIEPYLRADGPAGVLRMVADVEEYGHAGRSGQAGYSLVARTISEYAQH